MAIVGKFELSVTFTGLCLFVKTSDGLRVLLSSGMAGMEHVGAIKYDKVNTADQGTSSGPLRTHLSHRHHAFHSLLGNSIGFDFTGMPLNLTGVLGAKVKQEMMDPMMTKPSQQRALVASFHFSRGRIVGPNHSSFWRFDPPGSVLELGSGFTVEIDDIDYDPTLIEQQWSAVGLPALWPKKVSTGASKKPELHVEIICVPANEIDVDPQGPFHPPAKNSPPGHFPMLFTLFDDAQSAVTIGFDHDGTDKAGGLYVMSVNPLVCMLGGGEGP
jgi:hypothetical protein